MLENIKQKVNAETDKPSLLYADLKRLGTYMILTNSLNKDLVEQMCSKLIRLYMVCKD